jgi:hypothetical protein
VAFTFRASEGWRRQILRERADPSKLQILEAKCAVSSTTVVVAPCGDVDRARREQLWKSAHGTKRKLAPPREMSAIRLEADVHERRTDVAE